MKTGIVVDAACDLPYWYIHRHGLHVLPVALRLGDEVFLETRDPERTMGFYLRYAAARHLDAETFPHSVEEIAALFINDLLPHYDRVLVITVSRTRSLLFANASEAARLVLRRHRSGSAQRRPGFHLQVLDSASVFSGQALLVHETVRLLDSGTAFGALSGLVSRLSERVHCLVVPADLSYLYQRGRQRGEQSIGWLGYRLGQVLDIKPLLLFRRGNSESVGTERHFDRALGSLFGRVMAAMEVGLLIQAVTLSFAGHPQQLQQHPAYREFQRQAEARGIEVLVSMMGSPAGLYLGPGAVSLAYAA